MLSLPLAPEVDVALLTAGILLIAWEANRPGLILPSALGLLAILTAVGSILRGPQGIAHAGLLALAAVALAGELRQPTVLRITMASLLWFAAILWLAPTATSVLCALGVSGLLAWLARIARRARRNKGLD